MPTLRSNTYRIKTGTVSVATLNADSNALITNFAAQTDQGIVPWIAPAARLTPSAPIYGQYSQTLDMAVHGDGFWTVTWVFSYFTNDMLGFWHTSFLGSGVLFKAVTIKTFDDTDTAFYLTCDLIRPVSGRDMAPQQAGWQDVTMRFVKGVQIT